MELGIPYAYQYVDGYGQLYVHCPVCDKQIYLVERKDFESYTGIEYVKHYKGNHREDHEDLD